jgi:predicted transcriptional regulator
LRRDRVILVRDILREVKAKKRIGILALIENAKVSSTIGYEVTKVLLKAELIAKKDTGKKTYVFTITPEGKRALRLIGKIQGMLGENYLGAKQ